MSLPVLRSSSGTYGSGGFSESPTPVIGSNCTPTVTPADLGIYTRRVFWYSFALGFGLLLPFNFVINLIPWLSTRYAWPDFGFYASLALNNPLLAVQFVLIPYGRLVPSGHRIRGSLVTGAITLLLLASTAARAPPWFGLVLIAITGVAEAVMEATLFALLAQLPGGGGHTQAFMTGMAAAGVAAAALALGLHGALGSSVPGIAEVGAYVGVGVAVLAACVIVHALMASLPPVAAHIDGGDGTKDAVAMALVAAVRALLGCGGCASVVGGRQASHGGADGGEEADSTALLPEASPQGSGEADERDGLRCAPPSPILRTAQRNSERGASDHGQRAMAGQVGGERGASGLAARAAALAAPRGEHWAAALLRVSWAAAHPAAAVLHCFAATFLVYPGVLAQVSRGGEDGARGVPYSLVRPPLPLPSCDRRSCPSAPRPPARPSTLTRGSARSCWSTPPATARVGMRGEDGGCRDMDMGSNCLWRV